jgi:DNA-binding NarL/FixJ family response regulator
MRVVVADDVMLIREGIARLLTDAGVDVAAQVGDAGSLLGAVQVTQPDAAIVDIRMPPTHTDEGLAAAQQIRAEHPDVSVLILSQYIEPHYAMRLLEEHPERVGYLLKERVFDVANLIDALRRLADGETVVDPTIVARLFARKRRPDPSASSVGASARCWRWSPKGCPTGPSPPACSSPSAPSRPTSNRSSSSSASTPTLTPTGASSPSLPICAARPEPPRASA